MRLQPASTGAAANAAAALAPRDLAAHALDQLYVPPAGAGVWHGRWEIRWSFAGGSYATLNAEAWIDGDSGRHRVQLVHTDGGGPFEFELADDAGKLWYATTPSYALIDLPDAAGVHPAAHTAPDLARRCAQAFAGALRLGRLGSGRHLPPPGAVRPRVAQLGAPAQRRWRHARDH